MSYVNPSNNKPANSMPKRGGGGMLFLIMLAAGAFLLFSNMNGGSANSEKATDSTGNSGVERGNVSGIEPDDSRGKPMPTTGRDSAQSGWEMDGVENAKTTNPKPGTKTGNDGWKMEEVDTQKDDTGVRLSNKKEAAKDSGWEMEDDAGKKKKAADKGGWEMEEIDGKNDSGV